MPILARTVSHAIAASRDHPSKWRPSGSPDSGKKWSQVQIESTPSFSARRHPSRSSPTEQCCGSNCTPTLMRGMSPSFPDALPLQLDHAIERNICQLDSVHLPDV